MYINEIKIQNYGPIRNLTIIPEFRENGSPKPVVIVGKNGSGKTILLSHLVDSMVELKRKKYTELMEVKGDNYYRLGQKSYISNGALYSYVRLNYINNGKKFVYSDFMTKDPASFRHQYQETDFPYINFSDQKLLENGFYRGISGQEIQGELEENILLYFPVHRYYEPSWYNKENGRIGFNIRNKIIGRSDKSLIKENVIREIEQWILDLLLDKYIYESITNTVRIIDNDGTIRLGTEIMSMRGKNTILNELLNELLTIIYRVKYKNIEYARLGVGQKEDRRISILIKEKDGNEVEVAPTFSHLSSGEAMLISLFGTLLKEYDELSNSSVNSLEDVKGIVLIDEIDLNLHIEYAKEVLPQLLKKFPNVQFIFTTHSPFLLLGMQEVYDDNWQLVSMPEGESISVGDFSEIQQAYNIFVQGYEELKENYNRVQEEFKSVTKTLVITEGKTDWKHLKNAYNTFREKGEFLDLDIDFLEYEDINMSDSELYRLLNEFAKVPNVKKIIGIFDRDEGYGKKLSKHTYKEFGNNVFAFSIPIPDHRRGHQGISIEFLYKDEDLLRTDEEGRRIFLTSEFKERSGRHKKYPNISVANVNKIAGKTEENNSKIIDTDVFDEHDRSLALSKNNFANYVYYKHENFRDMDLSGFKEVFNIIRQIQQI
ncbi:AAA family ATPase [Parageobacillus sp. G301]|nr:AAA family ATPase [Parageobacillus sp. G301]GLH64514.1 hypothetical protein PG301_23530 [Parageobacillus sp. G301]